jgi:hypothetical protein
MLTHVALFYVHSHSHSEIHQPALSPTNICCTKHRLNQPCSTNQVG